jgi:hypothetical protein
MKTKPKIEKAGNRETGTGNGCPPFLFPLSCFPGLPGKGFRFSAL